MIRGEVRVVKDTQGAGMRELAQRLRHGLHDVYVGVPEGHTEANGTPLAMVAAANEFGTATIPQRSFLRASLRRNRARYKLLNAINLRRVVRGEITELRALELLGLAAAGLVRVEILDGHFVPNAPSTIARKGSSKPLIDTSMLLQSITFEVRGRGSRISASSRKAIGMTSSHSRSMR